MSAERVLDDVDEDNNVQIGVPAILLARLCSMLLAYAECYEDYVPRDTATLQAYVDSYENPDVH